MCADSLLTIYYEHSLLSKKNDFWDQLWAIIHLEII